MSENFLPRRRRHALPPAGDNTASALPPAPDLLILGLGTFGSLVAHILQSLFRGAGQDLAVCTIDNAMPEGEPPPGHLWLRVHDRRTALQEFPLLVQRYEETLLRGWSVAATHFGERGGNGVPLNTLMDFDLRWDQIRDHLGAALRSLAVPAGAPVGQIGQLVEAGPAAVRRAPVVLVIAGGCGSCGAALSVFMGYAVRQIAAEMQLPDPHVMLLLAGPAAFAGLTDRIQINYGATVSALQELARHGVNRAMVGGPALVWQGPAYDETLMFDDPAAVPPGGMATSESVRAFAWRVGRAACSLVQPATWTVYQNQVANHPVELDAPWPGLALLSAGFVGFEPGAVQAQLGTEIARRRMRALLDRLAAA